MEDSGVRGRIRRHKKRRRLIIIWNGSIIGSERRSRVKISIGKMSFIKHNMKKDDQFLSDKIQPLITIMIRGRDYKDGSGRARR